MRDCAQCGLSNMPEAHFCARCGAGLEIEVRIDEDRSAYNTPVAPGTILEGKHQVLTEIGRGGMGVVYRGHDLSLDRQVAIKVLPEHFNTDEEVIARFKKEARAMAALDHPNVVPVYAIGQQRNFHYFVMKFLEGSTVAELLDEKKKHGEARFEPKEVQSIVVQVCRGLEHAHARGLIHRDIKPGNIMVSPDGHVTIMDFGIVKEEAGGESLTRTGLVFGTPEYMAPEQAQGHSIPGPTTDLYSLGVVAYEMLSGVPPFRGETPFDVVLKHIKEPPASLVNLAPGVNAAFEATIFKALGKKPAQRYPTAVEMRAAIEAVDVDLFEMDESELEFANEPAPGGLPESSTLPPGVPPPRIRIPAPGEMPSMEDEPDGVAAPKVVVRRDAPSDGPPKLSEITSLPPPGRSTARGRTTGSDAIERASGPRPFVPVAEGRAPPPSNRPASAPLPRDPAVVNDRPGHYRTLTTKRTTATAALAQRRRGLLLVALVTLVAVTGLGLIAFSLTRTSGPAKDEAPAAVEQDAGRAAVDAAAGAGAVTPPADSEPRVVRLTILSTPPAAAVYRADQDKPLGLTPYVVRAQARRESQTFRLRLDGYDDEPFDVSFASDGIYRLTLRPREK